MLSLQRTLSDAKPFTSRLARLIFSDVSSFCRTQFSLSLLASSNLSFSCCNVPSRACDILPFVISLEIFFHQINEFLNNFIRYLDFFIQRSQFIRSCCVFQSSLTKSFSFRFYDCPNFVIFHDIDNPFAKSYELFKIICKNIIDR